MPGPDPATVQPPTDRPVRRRGDADLRLRVLSAVVLAPIALATAYLGGWPFVALWALAAVVILWEWARLVAEQAHRRIVAAGGAAFAAATALFGADRPEAAAGVIAMGVIAVGLLAPTGRRGWTAAGGAYAGAMLAAPAVLRSDHQFGFVAIVFLFAVVWATDVFAYFVGRFVGGPKLWPAISPKKTWAGAVGGATAAIAVAVAVATWAGLDGRPALAAIGFGLSVVAQIGDFGESALKRRFGAKDASHLIPGHGGLMDRLDGFLAAALAGTMLGLLRGGIEAPARGLLAW